MMSMQLTAAKPAASYVVKGKFTSSSNGQFLVLKGNQTAWSIYFDTWYFNGTMMNGKSNTGLLLLHQTRMVVVDQMESDGGKYSIDLYGSDKATIVNCKLEGAKTAAIYIHGSYGGEHKIANNLLNPYVGGDLRLFDGTISGIDIKGGVRNSISNNQIYHFGIES